MKKNEKPTWWSGFWKTKLLGLLTYTCPFVGFKRPAKTCTLQSKKTSRSIIIHLLDFTLHKIIPKTHDVEHTSQSLYQLLVICLGVIFKPLRTILIIKNKFSFCSKKKIPRAFLKYLSKQTFFILKKFISSYG